jgi:hypothetical protein
MELPDPEVAGALFTAARSVPGMSSTASFVPQAMPHKVTNNKKEIHAARSDESRKS